MREDNYEIKKMYQWAKVILHPDIVALKNPIVLEAEVRRLAFAVLGNVYVEYENKK